MHKKDSVLCAESSFLVGLFDFCKILVDEEGRAFKVVLFCLFIMNPYRVYCLG